jgi:hydrogenase 3 maturation protease
MQKLKSQLKNKLLNAEKIAVLCIGSELKGDDSAGMVIAGLLKQSLKKADKKNKIKVFPGGVAPENFTSDIKKFKPSHIIIVDVASFGKKPGEIALFDLDSIDGISFDTHRLPITMLIKYLLYNFAFESIMIGIQPKSLAFGDPLSDEVKKAIDDVFIMIKEVCF